MLSVLSETVLVLLFDTFNQINTCKT